MMKKILVLSVLVCTIVACSTVAITGRKQFNIVSNSELIPMSFSQYDEVLKGSKLSTNTKQVNQIQRVGKRIQKAVEAYMAQNNLSDQLKGFEWEFKLIEDENINAWCMPGGKVAFYTGIMPICNDDAGVAVVMGHEIAHAIANHGAERMSQGMASQLGMSALSIAMQEKPEATQALLMQSIGMGTQLGMLKFSRLHESEADKMGLIFMAMAGYDPHEAPDFWTRMAAAGGQAPPEFLSTHPHPKTRIKDLNAAIPEAMKYYKK